MRELIWIGEQVLAIIVTGSATGARKASPYMSTADDEQTGITSGVYEEDGRSDAESESDSSSLDDTDAKEVVAKELAKLDLNTSGSYP